MSHKELASVNKLWTIEELMEFLGVTRSWVYKKTFAKEIPFIKVGRHLRFVESRILEWLSENESLPE